MGNECDCLSIKSLMNVAGVTMYWGSSIARMSVNNRDERCIGVNM